MASLGRHIGPANFFKTIQFTATAMSAGLAISDPNSSWSGRAVSLLSSIGLSVTIPTPLQKLYYLSTATIAGLNWYFEPEKNDPVIEKMQTLSTEVIQGVAVGTVGATAGLATGLFMVSKSEKSPTLKDNALILFPAAGLIYGGGHVISEIVRTNVYEAPFFSAFTFTSHAASIGLQLLLNNVDNKKD